LKEQSVPLKEQCSSESPCKKFKIPLASNYFLAMALLLLKLGGEKLKRKLIYIFGVLLTLSFLLTTLDSVSAALIIGEKSKIPPYLLAWSESWAKGNLTELHRIRAEIVAQLEHNEAMIKATNGAILQPPVSPMTTFTYLTVAEWTDDLYNPYYEPPYDKVAWVENPTGLGGYSLDEDCTRLVAVNYVFQVWGEALTHCHPNAELVYGGGIYAWAKEGELTGGYWWPEYGEWTNYLIAMVALDPVSMWDWHFVGNAQVFSDSISMYYLGDSYYMAPYNHVSISSATPGMWEPVERNDVYVDLVKIIGYP
jgi:hypothetical protein